MFENGVAVASIENMEGDIMFFSNRASGFVGMAAGTLFVLGPGLLSPTPTEDPRAALITIQGNVSYFCVVPGADEEVFRCGCPAGDGASTPPRLRKPEQGSTRIPVLPGQGGKVLLLRK